MKAHMLLEIGGWDVSMQADFILEQILQPAA